MKTLATPFGTMLSLQMPSMKRLCAAGGLLLAMLIGLLMAAPSYAVDFANLGTLGGPLSSALTQLSDLTPGIKALVGFIAFVVALISLSALRNFGPVLFFVGVAIFAAVGLVIAGAIMGAGVGTLALL